MFSNSKAPKPEARHDGFIPSRRGSQSTAWRQWVLGLGALLLALMPAAAYPQVYRVRASFAVCDRGQCVLQRWGGSSVAIGRKQTGRELLLTAAHTLNRPGKLQHVEVALGDQWRPAAVLGTDRQLDLALLEVAANPLRSACLAEIKPGDGTETMAGGFPEGSQTVATPVGKVLAFNNPDVIHYRIPTRSGMSGGGLFTQDGQVLGIITAAGFKRPWNAAFYPVHDGTGFATSAPACRRFLQRTLGSLPDCRQPRPKPPERKPMETNPTPSKPTPAELPAVGQEPVFDVRSELAYFQKELNRTKAELDQLKAKATVNTELTERIVIVEGPPGRDGKDGRDGQDANPEDLVALSSAINSSLDFRERELTELANTTKRKMEELRVALTAAESRTADRLDDLVDEVSGLALDLEKLQARVGDNANAASLADQAVREKVRALEGENAKLKEAILAFEQWRKTYRTTVQILDPSGRVIKSESFGLNEPIQLQLKPTDKTASSTPERIGF